MIPPRTAIAEEVILGWGGCVHHSSTLDGWYGDIYMDSLVQVTDLSAKSHYKKRREVPDPRHRATATRPTNTAMPIAQRRAATTAITPTIASHTPVHDNARP